jgi:hypothetical protein
MAESTAFGMRCPVSIRYVLSGLDDLAGAADLACNRPTDPNLQKEGKSALVEILAILESYTDVKEQK